MCACPLCEPGRRTKVVDELQAAASANAKHEEEQPEVYAPLHEDTQKDCESWRSDAAQLGPSATLESHPL